MKFNISLNFGLSGQALDTDLVLQDQFWLLYGRLWFQIHLALRLQQRFLLVEHPFVFATHVQGLIFWGRLGQIALAKLHNSMFSGWYCWVNCAAVTLECHLLTSKVFVGKESAVFIVHRCFSRTATENIFL